MRLSFSGFPVCLPLPACLFLSVHFYHVLFFTGWFFACLSHLSSVTCLSFCLSACLSLPMSIMPFCLPVHLSFFLHPSSSVSLSVCCSSFAHFIVTYLSLCICLPICRPSFLYPSMLSVSLSASQCLSLPTMCVIFFCLCLSAILPSPACCPSLYIYTLT